MVEYLNKLTHVTFTKTSVILYIYPSAITHHIWAHVLKEFVTNHLIYFSMLTNVTISLMPDDIFVLNSSLIFGSSLVESGINDQ